MSVRFPGGPRAGGRVAMALLCRAAGGVGVWLAIALNAAPAHGTELPAGFEESIVVEVPLPHNYAQFGFASDGTLFVADKFGLVRIYVDTPGGYQFQADHPLAVDAGGERGINGFAADPDYETNGHVWVFYSTPAPVRNRVSRFRYDGTGLTDEVVMLEGPETLDSSHNGGCLRFASDRTLFISMGDDFQGSATAQDPFDLRGKILRIRRDGSPAPGNPFLDGSEGDPRVWALGLRNPYRISVQPGTDNLFIADVGNARWEEVNLGIAGSNYGWADVEGPEPGGAPGRVYPIHAYPHDGGAAIIGGDHAPDGFAPGYEGNYFYAEFVRRELWRLVLDANNAITEVERFATDFGRATDLQFGPGDALYYVCRSCGPASVRKIEYVGGDNRQPVARATADPSSGAAPLAVQFDGSGSSDADGDDLSYSWDLGDGTVSDLPAPMQSFSEGVYQATLSVDDGRGGTDVAASLRIVAGNQRPDVTVHTPADEEMYAAGDLVLYSGSASDPEDGQVDCSRVTWQVIFHHNVHTHPFLGPIQGSCVGAFQTPLEGERDPDQWFEIRMSAEDSGAPLGPEATLVGARSIEIRPRLASMDFGSTPIEGLTLTLDTEPFPAPSTVVGVVNATRTIGVLNPQLGPDGQWYRFVDWSDGGAETHSIATPEVDTTFTAGFECGGPEIDNLHIEPGDAGILHLTWDVATEGCLIEGDERYRIYAATHARPTVGAGSFPDDPQFRLIGTAGVGAFDHLPSPRDVYFLVVGTTLEGQDGASGHYGF